MIKALVDSLIEGKNYFLKSESSSKFLDIYVDSAQSHLKIDWFPGGSMVTEDTGVTLPIGKWVILGVRIRNFGPDAKLEMETRLQERENWESSFSQTVFGKSLEYQDNEAWSMNIGYRFRGTINSVEITTSDGSLSLDKGAILSNQTSLILSDCDSSCKNLCIGNSNPKACTQCPDKTYFSETIPSYLLGSCSGMFYLIFHQIVIHFVSRVLVHLFLNVSPALRL